MTNQTTADEIRSLLINIQSLAKIGTTTATDDNTHKTDHAAIFDSIGMMGDKADDFLSQLEGGV